MSGNRRAVAMSRTFRTLTTAADSLPSTVDEGLILDWPHPVDDSTGTGTTEADMRRMVETVDLDRRAPQIVASYWIGDHTWACFYRHDAPDVLVTEVRAFLGKSWPKSLIEVVQVRRDPADGVWGMLP